MERSEGKALGAGMVGVVAVGWMGLMWPDLAAAGIEASPLWARGCVDGLLCFAPLAVAPLPAVLGAIALGRT